MSQNKFNKKKLEQLSVLNNLFGFFFLFKPKKKKQTIIKEDVRNILVIGFFLIGDTVIFLPSLQILKKNFPYASITLVCGNVSKVLLEKQGIINDFVIVNCPWIPPFHKSIKNIVSFFSTIKNINKKKYDLAIDFRGDWRNIFYMNFINAERKISYNYTGGEYMLTDVVLPNEKIEHYTEEGIYLLKEIGCIYGDSDKYPVLTLGDTEKKQIDDFKSEHNLNNKTIIGIHPGVSSSADARKWEELKYAELLIRFSNKFEDYAFVIFEGPNEKESVEKIVGILKKNNLEYLIVSKPLKEYIMLLNVCDLLVCNDSGAGHLAGAYNISAVVIFGKGDPFAVGPYTNNSLKIVSHQLFCKPCNQNFCRFGTNECIKLVTTNEVYDASIFLLQKKKQKMG